METLLEQQRRYHEERERLMDAMVGYENDRIDVALNVNNLADKTYISTCLARGDCFYGTERTAILRVAAKF